MNTRKRILVVDDDATYRMVLTIQLTQAGFQVVVANDGLEALKWLNTPDYSPDLILLDLMMPRLSGLDVLSFLQSRSLKPPVVLMSAAERTIARQGVITASPDAFLPKPFTNHLLLDQIQRLLPAAEPDFATQEFGLAA
ncbi:hypothetical protein GCM10027299_26820 [Larkinella ripae]